jgi:hypothetical protein
MVEDKRNGDGESKDTNIEVIVIIVENLNLMTMEYYKRVIEREGENGG